MSEELTSVLIATGFTLAGSALVVYRSVVRTREEEDDRSQYPPTRWRRHLDKPSRLAFRPTRFDRYSGNSRRTQRC